MAKEKIVRCVVSRPAGTEQTSVRYVPLDVFQLWKNLMTGRHDFTVQEDCVSLWFDIDGDPNVTYADANYEKVVRVSLSVYSDEDGMFRRITRYFPAGSYSEIKPRFLAHYAGHFDDPRFPARIEETHGVWLKRHDL